MVLICRYYNKNVSNINKCWTPESCDQDGIPWNHYKSMRHWHYINLLKFVVENRTTNPGKMKMFLMNQWDINRTSQLFNIIINIIIVVLPIRREGGHYIAPTTSWRSRFIGTIICRISFWKKSNRLTRTVESKSV